MARRKYSEPHEEHMDDSWLIPYADILTLLLALFIVLYSSSQIDQKKLEAISQSFGVAFGGNNSIFEHTRTGPQIIPGMPAPSKIETMAPLGGDAKERLYIRETVQLYELKQSLDQYITENNLSEDLKTMLTGDGLMLRIRDTALFPSGSADLRPEARRLGAEIAKMLVALPQKVTIAGHTDTVPINTQEFPSNWELSSKRALNFMRHILSQQAKLEPARFNATGYGEYRPESDNSTAEGRARNRRVEILIMRQYKQQ